MMRGKYRIVALGQQMGIGVAGSHHATVSAVAKCNSPAAPYCIPNELIATEIGRFLHLPIPPAGIIHSTTATPSDWFASLDFNLTGNTLPPVDTVRCFAELPDLSTGLLLFDMLVANCDRHRQNFAVDFLAKPPTMNIFDHSHVLFGFAAGLGQQRLADLRDRLGMSGGSHTKGNRHCLLDRITTDNYLGKWLGRIETLPNFLIEELCREAVGLGITNTEADAAVDFLKYRRDHLRDIMENHRNEFHGITQWSLFS